MSRSWGVKRGCPALGEALERELHVGGRQAPAVVPPRVRAQTNCDGAAAPLDGLREQGLRRPVHVARGEGVVDERH